MATLRGTLSAQKMVNIRPSLLTLAFASYHDFLPRNFFDNRQDEFTEKARRAGVSKIAFLRHGQTAKLVAGVDFERQLTDEGRQQAKHAGEVFGEKLKPLFPHVLVSPAPRTMETAMIFLDAASAPYSVELTPIQSLYNGTMQPEGSVLFKKLGYAPLRDYVEADDANDREVAHRCLGEYAESVAQTIMETLGQDAMSKSSTLLVVGHAIYLPAAAAGIATLAGCNPESQTVILETNTKEAEGYLIDIDQQTTQYLSRTSM